MGAQTVARPCAETIRFSNGHEARLVRACAGDQPDELLQALGVAAARTVILIIGGADGLEEAIKPRLKQVFSRAVVRAANRSGAVILDGGTQSGIMELLGYGVSLSHEKPPLIGVAPAGLVSYPGSGNGASAEPAPLEWNHSHFVLAEGNAWGDETPMLFQLAESLGRNDRPVIAVLVNGGSRTREEVLQTVRRGWPLVIVGGTGRLADEIDGLLQSPDRKVPDADIAEIVSEGSITRVSLSDDESVIERVIAGRSARDETLQLARQRRQQYDVAANRSRDRFRRAQMLTLVLGLAGTLLAILHQHQPEAGDRVGQALQIAIILVPILVSILIAWMSRFRPGDKWVLLRAAAEAVNREIFRYRTRTGIYGDAQCRDTPREVKLAAEVAEITTRLEHTEVNVHVLPAAAFAPEQELQALTPADYMKQRVDDQVVYLESRIGKLGRRVHLMQFGILLVGGAGTLLAALGFNVWVALTTALAAAVTTKLETDQAENLLTNYNQSLAALMNLRTWWTALTEWEKRSQTNIDLLVDHAERVLESNTSGWVQQMQNALEKLRKEQTQHDAEAEKSS